MFARYVGGCLNIVGRRLSGACIIVFVACTLLVGCRPCVAACVPRGEPAFAVRAASVLVDGVSVGLWLCAIVCGCLSLSSLSVFVTVAGVVVGCCCVWVVSLAIVDIAP